MSSAPHSPDSDEAQILALETLRCALLSAGDLAALATLLDDDYLHVHGNGRVTDKAGTLDRLASQTRRTERGPLTLKTWGDAALLVGEQVNRVTGSNGDEQTIRGMVVQTLRRRDGRWRFLSLQFTGLRAD